MLVEVMSFDLGATRKQSAQASAKVSLPSWALAGSAVVILLLGALWLRFVLSDTDPPVRINAAPIIDSARTGSPENWPDRDSVAGISGANADESGKPHEYPPLFLPPVHMSAPEERTAETGRSEGPPVIASGWGSRRRRTEAWNRREGARRMSPVETTIRVGPEVSGEEDDTLWAWDDYALEHQFDEPDESPDDTPEDREFDRWWASDE